jgi:NADH dehydrogenase
VNRLAITGANGFLGRHLTAFVAGRRWEAAGVVRSRRGAAVVREAGGEPQVVPELLAAPLAKAFKGARAVVHLAGISAERDGATYEKANVGGMREVVKAARKAGVPRVIFLSGLGVARYGLAPHSTNGYFLSKMAAEAELFRSGLSAVALRPSYIIGPGSELIPGLLAEMAAGEVERVGDGAYRMQPIAVQDVAELVLACAVQPSIGHLVVDTVGPQALSYAAFIERVAAIAKRMGRKVQYKVREIAVADAFAKARAGGYRGLLPDELDVLLCDETAEGGGVETRLGRFLMPLDQAIAAAIAGAR